MSELSSDTPNDPNGIHRYTEYRPAVEVRLKGDGRLDEVVGEGVYVHLERLDSGLWWIDIGGIYVYLRASTGITAEWLNDNARKFE